ncbi:hypothetical protein H0H92_006048 [Tricholoma furcatifolium]|nr:hypothetical protein H0H92_006048 [Tricholoma furcatifolium]
MPVRSGSGYTGSISRRTDDVTVNGKVVKLGTLISPEGHEKSKVYHVAEYDGQGNPGYVIKIYQKDAVVSDREIAGLKIADQYVASDKKTKTLIMKSVKGTPLGLIIAEEPDHGKRQVLVQSWRPKVAKAAAEYARKKGIYHLYVLSLRNNFPTGIDAVLAFRDLNVNNIFVNGQTLEFIDWEHYYQKGEPGFTDDEKQIEQNLEMVWDSTQTPPEYKKSSGTKP